MTSTVTTTSGTTAADLNSQLAQAAQSIIDGATGSTLDINSLVQAMVTSKTSAQASAIATQQSSDNTELSAIGKIQSALSSLDDALSGFLDGTALSQVKASLNGTGITASTTTGAVTGSYSVSVSQLATASSAQSIALPSTSTLNAGTMTLQVGSSSMNVSVTSGESLSAIATAINNSAGNPGVSATVVNATDGQHLLLTSKQTGQANTITLTSNVTATDSSGNSTALFSQGVVAGQDAQLSINGLQVTSASNTVTNALTGVTLDISGVNGATPSTPVTQTLTLVNDTSASTTAINNFVSAYNNYVTTAASLSSYNQSTSTAGPLLGDSMTNGITNGLASLISSGITSGGKTYSLSSIGLNLQPDGTISVDDDTLQNALSTNSSALTAVFNPLNGIGAKLDLFMTPYTQASGMIDQRTSTLNADLSDLQDQSTQLTDYQNALTAQYNAQFTALNNLMTQMQNNTQYLTQLFGGKDSAGTLASNK
ncbi:flagellar filament capping protein FliD [Paraburkholderia caballeronis]|uniref:Flagellar hook-associated protein 2 n=1 Tax=Paraburkholderia caballeronis TaxID=416943 RepID=A0A1H7SP70_9BURK|nr:flagellar filament capping protein FliD [Paraburkholderia caballeronis]PXW22412.1 flagellar hook-associated protein 2 [Paraburkholderia caballeronis]PXW96070.1 flagellar hook-associated protein 2 [Paraburkholderia caballeronis]RAJ92436.1 flagellar hook-associated protein 2 [Paraburkholderia caballeronis]TDV08019.1 flagellar hook-associated protein 2 [Paraburkholderia caballeronis]TDV11917.1 flagellar hook-associated protein 2 [Paraburkholderia caballeronis]